MKKCLLVIICLILSICRVFSQGFDFGKIKDLANSAKDALKDSDKLQNIGDGLKSQLSNLLKGESLSSSLDNDFVKTQFMMMMLKALQNSVQEGKNQKKSGFLNAENLGALLQIIQQYKGLFKQESNTDKDATTDQKDQSQSDLVKNLLSDIAKKSLENLSSQSNPSGPEPENDINNAFLKNLMNQMMNADASGQPSSQNEKQGFSLKDLNQLMDTMKAINNTVNSQQIKEIADSFKEYFSSSDNNENENSGHPIEFEQPKEEGPNFGLIVIMSILLFILLVVILLIFRRYYKKHQYMAARMVEHKPLRNVESEKMQI